MVGHAFARVFSRVFTGLVRRTWLVVVATVVVCAGFAAQAVASLVEARYLDSSPPASPLPRSVQVEVPVPSKPDGAELVARNMFCSMCPPVPDGPGPANAPSYHPDAILIATGIGRAPVATVRVRATDVQGNWSVGDEIPGIGTVTRIGFASIDVEHDGRTGTLSLLDASAPGGRSDAGAATPAPAAASPWQDRIRQIDATTFEVERSLVRDLVSGSMKAAEARISPITRNGELAGLRVLGVRAGSLAGALGLANGDVLEAVDNTRIESANTLLDLYARLDKLASVELAGTRGGKPLAITLRLR